MATATISEVEAALGAYPPVNEEQAAAIAQFLDKHRNVARALLGAEEHVNRLFGPVKRHLEFVTDPEGGRRYLFCVLTVDAEPEEIPRLLRHLDDDWWVKQSWPVRRHLTFTADPA